MTIVSGNENGSDNNVVADMLAAIASATLGASSSTQFVLNGSNSGDPFTLTCNGTGFTFSGNTPTGGTLTSVSVTGVGAGLQQTWSGFSLSVPTVWAAITAHDETAFNNLFFAGNDVFTSHSGVYTHNYFSGFGGNDIFNMQSSYGNAGADSLNGGDGDDTFNYGTNFGNVFIDGGAGHDTISLHGCWQYGVYLDNITNVEEYILAAGWNYGFSGATSQPGETITMDGSALAATHTLSFSGSPAARGSLVLIGGAGNDQIYGGTGDDTLTGGAGNDSMGGGAGADKAVFSGNWSSYTITSNTNGTTTVAGPDGTDTLSNIEQLQFADRTVSIGSSEPWLVSIATSPGSGAELNAGKLITFTVTMSEAVTVDTTGGAPWLDLSYINRRATYVGGSGTNVLTFRYVVAPGNDTFLTVGALTVPSGSSIKNSAGVSAFLLASPYNTGIQIKTIQPYVAQVTTSPGSGSVLTAGQTVNFYVTFVPWDVVVDTSGGAPTLTLNDNQVATYTSGSGTNTLTYTYTVQPGDSTSDLSITGFVVPSGSSIKDGAGNLTSQTGLTANTLIRIDATSHMFTGTAGDDVLAGTTGNDVFSAGGGVDRLTGGTGNDTLDGGLNVDTAVVSGNRSAYTVTQTTTGNFTVTGPDGTDTLTAIEYLRFDDQTMRLLPGTGTSINWSADPSTYMAGIRDFDGNDLGGAASWRLIGTADVNGDGRAEHILFNRAIGRWAEVGTEPDGLTYFSNNNWAGDTRVVGIYIDPLVTAGIVVQGSDTDSQRRFQNDLFIDNIHGILGQNDYNHDGLQEVYFSLTDGTAYLHAYMHADGNIQYANYQNRQQVIDYLSGNGWASSTWAGWFPSSQAPMDIVAASMTGFASLGNNLDPASNLFTGTG